MRQIFEHTGGPTPLCEIMEKYQSDKGAASMPSWHSQTPLYHQLFNSLREKPIRVFELGIGLGCVGASLYGWREYFPKASIQGADIDRSILFQSERIRTYFCDQTLPGSIQYLWNEPELQEAFDIIVEDGVHTFEASVCFFENSVEQIKKGGYQIIEDIQNAALDLWDSKIDEWKQKYPHLSFTMHILEKTINQYDNNMLVIHMG